LLTVETTKLATSVNSFKMTCVLYIRCVSQFKIAKLDVRFFKLKQ